MKPHSGHLAKWVGLAIGLLIGAPGPQAAGFTKAEWDNPGKAGGSLWLKNETAAAVRIDSLFVRDNGIHRYGEIAFKAGPAKMVFRVPKAGHGQWARLIPSGPGGKMRIRARDSLLIQDFEYGNRLAKRKGKVLADQYVLDLKAVDNTGDSSIVKISQTVDSYYIGANASWTESAPGEE
jgi:hypothetical protein